MAATVPGPMAMLEEAELAGSDKETAAMPCMELAWVSVGMADCFWR